MRDFIWNEAWQMGLGADVTFYPKPEGLNAAYGNNPVSFQILVRIRPAKPQGHHQPGA